MYVSIVRADFLDARIDRSKDRARILMLLGEPESAT
jgi:hypothetical protein